MNLPSAPYQKRPIRFLELWQQEAWRLKVYGIASGRPAPRDELIAAAKAVAAERLADVAASLQHYSAGFLGIHDGRNSNFVFVDWWADENQLHHHVYLSPTDDPSRLTYATPTGVIACVWDLRVLAARVITFRRTVPNRPDAGKVNPVTRMDHDSHLNRLVHRVAVPVWNGGRPMASR